MFLEILKKMTSALKGIKTWKKISKPYPLPRTIFILIYPSEEHLIVYLKKWLYTFMQEKKVSQIVVLSTNHEVLIDVDFYFKDNINIRSAFINENDFKALMCLYFYSSISDRLLVLSVKNLYGRDVSNLIGNNEITESDLVAGGLFTLNLKDKVNHIGRNFDFEIYE